MKLPFYSPLHQDIDTYFYDKNHFKGKHTLFKFRKDGFFFTKVEVRLVMHEPMNGVIGFYEGMKRSIIYLSLVKNSVFLVKGWGHDIDVNRPFYTKSEGGFRVMKRTIDFGKEMYNQNLLSFEDTIKQLSDEDKPIVWHNFEGLSSEVSESTDRPQWEEVSHA